MKKFLAKIAFALGLPFLLLLVVEWQLRRQDNSYFKVKSEYIYKNKDQVSAIFFGSSHSFRGINPAIMDIPSASLCLGGSALNIDYELFDQFKDGSKLEFVIFDLSLTYVDRRLPDDFIRERKLSHYFKLFPKEYQIRERLLMRIPLSKSLAQKKNSYVLNEFGFVEEMEKDKLIKFDTIPAERHAARVLAKHAKVNDAFFAQNVGIVRELISTCKKLDLSLVFISPPKHQAYNELISPVHETRRDSLLSLFSEGSDFHFWNDEELFIDQQAFFFNSNHLRPDGGAAYSKVINDRLLNIASNIHINKARK